MAQYELHQYEDPQFPIIYHLDCLHAGSSFHMHWHEGVEILYCTEGRVQFLLDGTVCSIEPGEILIINSGKIHIGRSLEPVSSYYCLILNRAFLESHGLPVDGAQTEPVTSDPDMAAVYRQIIREMTEQQACYKSAVLGLCVQLYALLLRGHRLPERGAVSQRPQAVKVCIRYLRDHFAEDSAIEDACQAAGVSRYTICRLFKSYVGLTPVNFLNALRCDEARALIASGECNVSEAAHRVGVENLSYFSRLYRRHIGQLPSQKEKSPIAEEERPS